ncbi:hypothetical protein ACFPN2_09805 [Steroidobacter flavus]|uniref:WYL domain-containing protein n=1 Tax=Steroidobacter flavus TaxID=1842136 RepID=A0ABV8SSK9_9GAMM
MAATDPHSAIVDAIKRRVLLRFRYNGRVRTVQPYCVGVSTAGRDVLRAIEVGGARFGKLWTLSEMSDVQVLEQTFTPDDPNYNPDDKGMTKIYCRI